MNNALNWFEIPVTDLARAKRFYGAVLQGELREETMAGTAMAILPYDQGGVGGALVSGESFVPGAQGAVVYLNAGDDLDGALARFAYAKEDGETSLRIVWPLGLFYWGAVWTL